jgi:hypothetical protein
MENFSSEEKVIQTGKKKSSTFLETTVIIEKSN